MKQNTCQRPIIRLCAILTSLLGLMVIFMHPLAAASDLENKVKAAYVYNFTKFVDWPGEGSGALNICIVGSDPLRTLLGELNNREVRGRLLNVVRLKEPNLPEQCHMIYISRSEERQLPLILQRLQGTRILTVSDIPQFVYKGGMIGFVTENNRVKIEISQRSLKQAGLKVSAKLLEVARVIP